MKSMVLLVAGVALAVSGVSSASAAPSATASAPVNAAASGPSLSSTFFEADARRATQVSFTAKVTLNQPEEYTDCVLCQVIFQKRKSSRWVNAYTGITDENGYFTVLVPKSRVLGKRFRVLTPSQASFVGSVSNRIRISEWTRHYCSGCSTREEQLAALGG